MAHAPFDGVLLDDPRPPVSGAQAMLLHLRVARRLAKAAGWAAPSLDGVQARAQACRELMAHGLLPAALRGLRGHGLDLGDPGRPHSLASLAAHLESYLGEVDRAGCLEPDVALWRAVDRERKGRRGLWVERTAADGPIAAGLRDLLPSRLRALACVPRLGGAVFALATRRGDGGAGLFGSSQPLAEWLLDGLEEHGQGFPGEVGLAEPDGWGSCPWAPALEGLFQGPLDLGEWREVFRRGLAEGPVDLLRHGLEQVCAWLEAGLRPREITVIHPAPHLAAALLAPLLAAEGIPLHVRGGLLPLLQSPAWSPLWLLLTGAQRLDPIAVSGGLRASRRQDLRAWAEALAQADQDGPPAFAASFAPLRDRARDSAEGVWRQLAAWREGTAPARDWAARIESLAGILRLPLDPEDFFAPLGLLKESWGGDAWTFAEMLTALRAFLEAARSARVPRDPDGIRLVAPGTVLDDWDGSRATLVLDLSEGAWPARPEANPDLDLARRTAVNQALLAAARAGGDPEFPPALQRFWLPRSEHGDQLPRAFQLEAYAFNKVLAMTRERLTVLSPGQDDRGRPLAQGPFWTALEGAGPWTPDPARVASRLRWRWEGHERDPRAEARAQAALVRGEEEALAAQAPPADLAPGSRAAWLKGGPQVAPTVLESLAQCPFRSLAERVWGLAGADAGSRLRMALGVLAHRVLEAALAPYVAVPDWTAAFLDTAGSSPEALRGYLTRLWTARREAWLAELDGVSAEQGLQAAQALEALLPNLAEALLGDALAEGPTRFEVAFLFPERLSMAEAGSRRSLPLQGGWTRTILALEQDLGPVELDLGNGRTLAVAGKVDRLERWAHAEGGHFLRVTDYKASKAASLKAYAEEGAPFAAHLQTPLYMLMAQRCRGEISTAVLLPLREEFPAPFSDHLRALAQGAGAGSWQDRLLANLARFDARLEAGDFPPTPGDHCRWCRLGALCGRPVDVDVAEDEGED